MVLEKRRHVAFTLVETHYHITLFTFLYLRISYMIHVFLINIIIVYYSHFYIFVSYMIHTNFQILFINTIARNLKFTVNGRINRFALSRKHAVVIHESRKKKTRMMNSKQWLDFCPCFHKSFGRSLGPISTNQDCASSPRILVNAIYRAAMVSVGCQWSVRSVAKP